MRHQELYRKRSVDIANAFSNLIDCAGCNSRQPMKVKAVYPALWRGRDVVFCRCEECGAESRVCNQPTRYSSFARPRGVQTDEPPPVVVWQESEFHFAPADLPFPERSFVI